MKKVTAVGAAALVVGGTLTGGAMLLAPAAQAAPQSDRQSAGVSALPSTGHQTGYVQRGETVSVYRDGKVLAEVTAESAAHPGGKGKLVLTVEAKRAFSFRAGQFLWEDKDGGDHEAVNTRRKISVAANSAKSVTIAYTGVSDGDVIWVPDLEAPVGAWYVKGSTVDGAAEALPPGYVQRGSTVSVYRAGKVVATVTPQSAKHAGGKGAVKLDVRAVKKFKLVPASFIWEDADGGDHQAVNGKKAVTVKAKSSTTITVKYKGVADGALVWSPGHDTVAGLWAIG